MDKVFNRNVEYIAIRSVRVGCFPNTVVAIVAVLFFSFAVSSSAQTQQSAAQHKWAIVLHGGAGVIERKSMDPKTEAAYRASLNAALQAGAAVLDKSGSSLHAIEAGVQIVEGDPLFNAGRGAVFSPDRKNTPDSPLIT